MKPCRVSTRSWCRVYAAPQPAGQGGPTSQLPAAGAALAEAYMPAPISWSVVALSSNPISNVQIGLELAGVEGGWQTFPGLLTLPVLNLPLVPGRAVRVVVRSGTLAAGELVSCVIAPSSWPAWAEPDPREWQPSPGLYE